MGKMSLLAMLLAGGQGSRLYALTTKLAKPAVSFGSKYRIIDFPLSNCVNSGIDTVGVLTQYQPLILNDYIGNGEPWDLDRNYGGVHTLPPYQAKSGADWYKGTANAIYQNIPFIERYDPENVIILSGDHIYRMDYNKMLEFHKAKNADITIAVIGVPENEASRFGIMSFDEERRITDFEEKPAHPKSFNASMGIYIFKTKELIEQLRRDEADADSSKDFGKNIIPHMLATGKKMYAYSFDGYWKDVGTVSSLWEANMDLIGEKPVFDLADPEQPRIYSRNPAMPPQYIAPDAVVSNSLVTEGCEIEGTIIDSVLSEGVKVGKGAVIKDSVIMRGSVIGANAVVSYGMIDENVTVGANVVIGDETSGPSKIALVGRDSVVADGSRVAAGAIVENA